MVVSSGKHRSPTPSSFPVLFAEPKKKKDRNNEEAGVHG
jgi:hypothetical protein